MSEQLSPPPIESDAMRAEHVLEILDTKYQQMTPVITRLLEVRHELFSLPEATEDNPAGTPFSHELALTDQLYDDPSYNIGFFYADLGLRNHGAAEFHNEREKYNPLPNDDEELLAKKAAYRQAILTAGLELGFLKQPRIAERTALDMRLGIEASSLSPIERPVDAVIIPAAAGVSNAKRLRDAIRNIESGAIKTNRLIFATCDRPVNDAEKERTSASGFRAGDTEYESVQLVIEELLHTPLPDEHQKPVHYGHNLVAKQIDTEILIGETPIELSIVSAPFDPERIVNNRPADRANTEETFLAITDLLTPGRGLVVLESHDTWVPYQEAVGEKVFGLALGKDVVGTGPQNSDRLTNRDGQLDITNAEGVVDEIAKTYSFLTDVVIAAKNQQA